MYKIVYSSQLSTYTYYVYNMSTMHNLYLYVGNNATFNNNIMMVFKQNQIKNEHRHNLTYVTNTNFCCTFISYNIHIYVICSLFTFHSTNIVNKKLNHE